MKIRKAYKFRVKPHPKGAYTDGIGYIASTGDAVFNVPIHTIVLTEKRSEICSDSGIVHDSNSTSEWQEYLLKGKFLSSPRPDFQLIETILWQRDSGFWLLDRHLARLSASASYFGYPLDLKTIEQRLHEALNAADATTLKIRLLLHQDGTLKTSDTLCEPPSGQDLATLLPSDVSKDILPKITVSKHATNSSWPFLYHKTTRRELYTSEREQALDRGYFEVIFTNEKGEITEGSISNIMLRQGQHLFTPPIGCGLLAGVCREHLLELHPRVITEKIVHRTDLLTADAIYLVNSIRGIVEVSL